MDNAIPLDSSAVDLPDALPVLPLREFVAFPYMVLPMFAARERSIAAVDDALAGNRMVLLVAQRDAQQNDPEPDDLIVNGTVIPEPGTLGLLGFASAGILWFRKRYSI